MKLLISDNEKVRVIADSAIGRNRQPWFLPDAGSNWRFRLAAGYRVSKLGKNITPKFMERHIDAATLLWVAEADDFAALDYMDGAVVCGEWQELPADFPAEELAEFTRCTTIKNGDILALMLPKDATQLKLNDHISIEYNNNEVLSFNIK